MPYIMDMILQPGQSYILRGYLDKSDLVLANTNANNGVLIRYYDSSNSAGLTPSYCNKK